MSVLRGKDGKKIKQGRPSKLESNGMKPKENATTDTEIASEGIAYTKNSTRVKSCIFFLLQATLSPIWKIAVNSFACSLAPHHKPGLFGDRHSN